MIILSLMCLLSCKHDKQEIAKILESRKWNMSGWPGMKELMFTAGGQTNNQARFVPGERLFMSSKIEGMESQFNAHGYEVLPGSINLDSCHTYAVKNNIIKIASHGHGGKDEVFYYKFVTEKEPGFKLVQVTEKDFVDN
jgi:hypothetical protein